MNTTAQPASALPVTHELAVRSAATRERSPWRIIWLVGGAVWLCITCIEIVFLWPASGKTLDAQYVLSPGARLFAHALVFVVSACAYRWLLTLGWPDELPGRLRVSTAHVLLALGVVLLLVPTSLNLSAAVVDRHFMEISDELRQLSVLPDDWMTAARVLQFWLPPYALGLALVAQVNLRQRYQSNALAMARLSTEFANTRLAMLSAQLQPHFLFNALHAISQLVGQDPERAKEMIARLGEFLRYALDSSKHPWVTLADELAGLQAYLAVQQVRFQEQLQIAVDVDQQVLSLSVPSMLLQPLVENAIEYGRAVNPARLRVSIACNASDGILSIAVRNSAPHLSSPLSPAVYGDGLRNVEARLRAAFGADALLNVAPDPDGSGTLALLQMPASHAPVGSAQR